MAAYTIGGADIESMDFTRSWGVAPASASFNVPGAVDVDVDDGVAVTIGGTTFNGTVTSVIEDRSAGLVTRIQAADERVWLHREYVCGTWNNVEVIEDDPQTLGIDRKKRYWHILPDNWHLQTKTWTDVPYTAAEILDYIRLSPEVSHPWVFDTHAAQEKPVLGIDANNGAKVASVLHEISEKQGLVFTIIGESTLVWARKGDGTTPTPSSSAFDRRSGTAIANNDTNVRVIGDRNRYQYDSIDLEPDWVSHYQSYWLEAAWVARVDAIFGPFASTDAGQSELFAKAKSVTLSEYVAEVGNFADLGMWGEVSRMELPVWIYLQDVVFKAYRVPYAYWSDGEDLVEGLLRKMVYDTDGSLTYGDEDYPDEKAFVIVQGQQVSLIDARYQKLISPEQLTAARTLWTPNNRFTLDLKNRGIIFEDAAILPGEGAAGLFVFPNHGVLASDHDAYNIAVPNAGVSIAPAPVRVSLVFEIEKYFNEFGSGNRRGPHYVRGLRMDALMVGGTFSEEVEYIDGDTADEKAAEIADGLILRQAAYEAGGFKRRGTVGMAINGSIDRITIRVNGNVGIEEEIEFSKERSPTDFASERDLDRKQRTKELFPGRDKNREEVFSLQQIARIGREMKRGFLSPAHSVNDVVSRPIGGVDTNPTVRLIERSGEGATFAAGEPLFNGSGEFLGVVIAENTLPGHQPLATAGIAPVRVKGAVEIGDTLYWVEGETYATATDTDFPVGAARMEYVPETGSEEAIALLPCRLIGKTGTTRNHPFQVTVAAPAGTGDPPRLQVELDSWVRFGDRADDDKVVSGLGAPFEIEPEDGFGMVFLEAAITGTSVTTIHVRFADEWGDDYPHTVKWDPSPTDPDRVQTKAWIMIAHLEAESAGNAAYTERPKITIGDTTYQIVQHVRDNLAICERCYQPTGDNALQFQTSHSPVVIL